MDLGDENQLCETHKGKISKRKESRLGTEYEKNEGRKGIEVIPSALNTRQPLLRPH